ncbi:MAG: hypothetical protein IT198_13915 [Acidimicrobiia bacterium]|nr:hypothetical protein [Acidimicrobiia bacterium]
MNVGELIRIIARRWLIVVGCTFGGLMVVWLLAFKPPTFQLKSSTYCATATVLMDSKTQGAAASGVLTAIYARVLNDVEVVSSEVIAKKASEKVGGKYSPLEIMQTTGAENEFGTQTMNITSCGDSPSDAVQVTNAVVTSYQDWTAERQDAANVLGPNRYEVVMLTAPVEPTSPSGFPAAVWVFLGLVGGLIVGVIVAVGVESVQATNEALPVTREAVLHSPTEPMSGGGFGPQTGHPGNATMTLPAVTAGRSRRPRRK